MKNTKIKKHKFLKFRIINLLSSKKNLLFFFFLITTIIFGQSKYTTSRILDSKTKLPVSFATILLKDINLGLYANEEGDFTIKNLYKQKTNFLVISSIGYKTKSISTKELETGKINIIYLSVSNEQLDEIIIKTKKKRIRSRKLIREAIKRIPVNYQKTPFSFVSYYRDYLKKKSKYYNMNEAIIQTLDSGFTKLYSTNNFRLLEYKRNQNFPRENDVSEKYDTVWKVPVYYAPKKFIPYAKIPNQGGNELFILLAHDPIRNFNINSFSFINKFSVDFLRNHSFNKPITTYQDNLLLYKIKFETRKVINHVEESLNLKSSHYVFDDNLSNIKADAVLIKGYIYINPKDYTIHKINYNANLESTNKRIYALTLEYGYRDSKKDLMGLRYISFNNEFFDIDQNDKNYLKINSQKTNNNSILLSMSADIDPLYATDKKFYQIKYYDQIIQIKKIVAKGNKIRIYLKNSENLKLNLTFNFTGIRDVNGRILNQKKVIQYYQYRELFVQGFNKELNFNNKCYLKNKPLERNCVSIPSEGENYIMNSPFTSKSIIKD